MVSSCADHRASVAILKSPPIRPTIPPSELQARTPTLPPLTEIERLALDEAMQMYILQHQIQ